jgi:hypothetical protein
VDITEFLNRGKHISILALYGINGFIDFDYVEGGYTADDFLSAVQFMIVPHLRPYPEDNSVLVIDNCTVHKNDLAALVAMVEAVGAKVRFLACTAPSTTPSNARLVHSRRAGAATGTGSTSSPCTSKSSFDLITAVRTAKLPWPPTGRAATCEAAVICTCGRAVCCLLSSH